MRKQACDHFKDQLANIESDVITRGWIYHMDDIGYNFIRLNIVKESFVGNYSLTFQ